jgi:hypothetical protein
MRCRYAAPGLGAIVVLLWAPPLFAAREPQPPIRTRLTYTRPPECPSESTLRYEVARQFGEDPFVEEGLFRVVLTVTREKSYSRAGTIGVASRSSIVAAAGGRVVYTRPLTERFHVRGLFEVEYLLKPKVSGNVRYSRRGTP